MDKKQRIIWLSVAVLLLAAAVALYFTVNSFRIVPYLLGAAAMIIIIDVFHKNWLALSGLFLGAAAFLRFALRGYAWWGYLAAFIAALVIAHRFLSRTLFRAILVLVFLGFSYFCFVEFFIIRDAFTDEDPKRDYVIVLGAAVYGEEPSLTLVRRLEGALAYLEEYPASVAIVSGGMGAGENITEAQAMHDWLIEHEIPEERILMEEKATSTLENLDFSFAIIRERGDEPDGNVAIVSSAYHLYRAKLMARNLGVEAVGVAAPWGRTLVMFNYFIREAFGVTHLWAFGN